MALLTPLRTKKTSERWAMHAEKSWSKGLHLSNSPAVSLTPNASRTKQRPVGPPAKKENTLKPWRESRWKLDRNLWMGRGFFLKQPFSVSAPNPGTFLFHLIVSSLFPSLSTFSPFFQLGLAQQDTGIPSQLVVFVLTFPLLPVSSAAPQSDQENQLFQLATGFLFIFFLLVSFFSRQMWTILSTV